MTTLHLDLETYGDTPIKNGAHRYAEDAEVLLVAVAWDDEPVSVWDTQDIPGWREALQRMIDHADRVVIQNSAFDRTVLRHNGVHIPLEKIEDTMVLALMHSLPASLGTLCDVLGVPSDKAKDKDGKKLINLFCKPRPKNTKLRRATRETHPDEWTRFVEYARLDVDAMRSVHGLLPRWNYNEGERELWRFDQDVNDRGVAVDTDLARSALRAFERASRSLAARADNLTGGAVGSATQRGALLDHLRETHGVDMADMTGATVTRLLREGVTPEVRELLEIRQQAAATSPAKYKALLGAASRDGRLRGTIQFCGAARTARDAGRIFQPQNLVRTPDWFDGEVQEITIAAFKADAEDIIWDNVSDRCAMSVRGCLMASTAMKLCIADLSNIEGRVLAWLAGEEWKIAAFKAYDRGEGPDLYKVTAGRILVKDPYAVTKEERQTQGKVPELACLGPQTRVITKSGVKLITEVTAEDLLWDGVSWVTNTGLLDRGLKSVLNLCGVEMTPDHSVMVGGIWQSAQMVASCLNCRAQALETGSESLRSLASTSALAVVCARSWSNVLAEPGRTERTSTTSGAVPQPGATFAPKRKLGAGPRRGSGTPKSALTRGTGEDCAVAFQPASTGATTQMIKRTQTMVDAAFGFTSLGEQTGLPISHTSSPSTGGTSQSLNSTGSTTTGDMSRATSASSENGPTATTCATYAKCSSASTSLKRVYDIANAGPRNRFTILTDTGALVVHNCGFGGSVGAFRKMGGQIFDETSDEAIGEIVQAWRKAHPATVRFWYAVEGACRSAIRNPGESFEVRGLIRFDQVNGPDGVPYVRCRLPSGRYLSYRNMHITETGTILYEGLNQYTRKWELLDTYYGKLVENIVQAVARDVFMTGLRRAELSGYPVVLRVHDELVCEVPDEPGFTHERLAGMMATNPSWSTGLPLAAAGFEALRYRKE